MKIVALSGWKQSGKDTVAEYLIKKHGFVRVSFADTLKDMAAEQYGIPRNHFDLVDRKESPIHTMPVECKDDYSRMVNSYLFLQFRTFEGEKPVRYEIQDGVMYGSVHGSDNMRKLYWTPRALAILEGSTKRCANSNYWVERAVSNLDPNKNYVISDVRFKNEISQLEQLSSGNVIEVRVNRFASIDSTDASEHDLDNHQFHYYLNNKKSEGITLDELYRQVDGILEIERVLELFPDLDYKRETYNE